MSKKKQPKTGKGRLDNPKGILRFLYRGSVRTKVLTSFSVVAGTLIVLGLISFFSIYSMNDKFTYVVEHDAKVIENARQLAKLVVDMETGQRGFIITGKDEFLDPYNNGLKEFKALIQQEIVLVSDNLIQVERLHDIQALVNEWLDKAALPEIELARKVHDSKISGASMKELLSEGVGKDILDRLRGQFKAFTDLELQLTQERYNSAYQTSSFALISTIVLILLGIVVAFVAGVGLSNSIAIPIGMLQESAEAIATGDLEAKIEVESEDELGELAIAMITMRNSIYNQNWLLEGSSVIADQVKGEKEIGELADAIISSITPYLNGQMGAFYESKGNGMLELTATYAYDKRSAVSTVKVGEGLVGQVATKKKSIIFKDVPQNYFNVNSGVGAALPSNLIIFPIMFEDQLKGVIEIATLHDFNELHLEFVDNAAEAIGIAMNTAQSRTEVNRLLKDSQGLTKKLQSSEKELKKAKSGLEIAYKKEKEIGELRSRFVATASHQFRTPLTVIQASMGVLSMQMEGVNGGVKPQFEKAYKRVIGQIGRMTELMNDVLILGKVNAGSIKPVIKSVNLLELCEEVVIGYNETQTDGREIKIKVNGKQVDVKLDTKLIEHAISNLVSNAFKYSVGKSEPEFIVEFEEKKVQVSIKDKGIGIPNTDIKNLFEPFYRASNVSRISGTGLGIAIAKEYVELNGGTISVKSKLNKGTEIKITLNK